MGSTDWWLKGGSAQQLLVRRRPEALRVWEAVQVCLCGAVVCGFVDPDRCVVVVPMEVDLRGFLRTGHWSLCPAAWPGKPAVLGQGWDCVRSQGKESEGHR